MQEKLHEECGVFGIYTNEVSDVASFTYLALYALQHRGQESCGIVVNDMGVFTSHTSLGLVNEVFNKSILEKLGSGKIAVGHVRYATKSLAKSSNNQPLVIRHVKGPMTLAYNGSIVNAEELKEKYEFAGGIFHSTSDAEVIAYSITQNRLKTSSMQKAVEQAMHELKGAYSIVISSPQKLIAARDPNGFRPLCIGTLDGGYVIASETCAFDSIGAVFLRDIKPGEIVIIDQSGIQSIETHCGQKSSLCVFEFVYFARPDSVIENSSVHKARICAGQFLAQEHPVEADIVIGVPDSGLDAALGYAQESGIPYGVGFIKNRYVGRTFIQPAQIQRENSVKIKLNVISEVVKGKRVVIIDDSIVRGTTCARIVNLLREAGAIEVHMRLSSPPFVNPCFFGTDIDSRDNLIACRMTIDEIAKEIGVDSLGYLSIEAVHKIAGNASCGFCDACFSGKYPIPVPDEKPKDKFDKKINKI